MKYCLFSILILFSIFAQAQQFTGSFDLLLLQERKNDSSAVAEKQSGDTISYYFSKEKTAIIIHAKRNQPDLRLVFSPKDSTITGLFELNGKKGGYILPMDDKYWPAMKYALGEKDILSNSEVNYTENKKKIDGYFTNEVSCSNDKMEATFWIAEEIELSLTQVMAYQFVGSGKESKDIEMLANCGIQSLALYTLLFDKKRNSTIILQIENLSTAIDPDIFSTMGHGLSDMRKKK